MVVAIANETAASVPVFERTFGPFLTTAPALLEAAATTVPCLPALAAAALDALLPAAAAAAAAALFGPAAAAELPAALPDPAEPAAALEPAALPEPVLTTVFWLLVEFELELELFWLVLTVFTVGELVGAGVEPIITWSAIVVELPEAEELPAAEPLPVFTTVFWLLVELLLEPELFWLVFDTVDVGEGVGVGVTVAVAVGVGVGVGVGVAVGLGVGDGLTMI